jgi:23S rRNA (adenine2503-C2)-methyltransferase
MRENLKGLLIPELEVLLNRIGEEKFRARQIFQWIYQKRAKNFQGMSNISKKLKEGLDWHFDIRSLKILKSATSADGTQKIVFETENMSQIESVLIPPISLNKNETTTDDEEINRLTLCVSTQAGCPLGCVFCATGYMKFQQNLTCFEIVDQIIQAQDRADKKITNIVFMGMGEPLLNYDNVMKSIEIINHELGFNIANKHITLSTSGIVIGINKLADEGKKFKLAVSLHSLDDEIRTSLMPINKKYPLGELLESVIYYYQATKIRPTFEFILFDGINDRKEDLKKMIMLSKQIPCKFNLIHFHSSPLLKTKLLPSGHFNDFVDQLRANGLTVMVRNSSGEDIAAACGQLAGLENI